MASKRSRTGNAMRSALDDLLGISMLHQLPPDSSDNDDNQDSDNTNGLSQMNDDTLDDCLFPTTKRRRAPSSDLDGPSAWTTSHSPSASSSSAGGAHLSPTSAVDGLGGSEIDLLRRKDEEMADMAVFLAKAVGEQPSAFSVAELTSFLRSTGAARVMLALKRAECAEVFVVALCRAHPDSAVGVDVLRLLTDLSAHLEISVFFQKRAIEFFVEALHVKNVCASPNTMNVSSVRSSTHWSVRKKRALPAASAAVSAPSAAPLLSNNTTEPQGNSSAGASNTASSMSSPTSIASLVENRVSLSLNLLLRLVFEHNRRLLLSPSSHFSVPLGFVRAGGLEQTVELIGNNNVANVALSLLEVLTASDALRQEGVRLQTSVPTLVRHFTSPLKSVQLAVLKVLTNITNLMPSVLCVAETVSVCVPFLQRVLMQPATVRDEDERETFALCCAINVVKHEAMIDAERQPTFTAAFVAQDALLPALATSMMCRYRSSEAEQLVLSGYTAILLGALSLVAFVHENGPTTLRIPVITAVAAAARGTRMGKLTDRQPMRMVAAIIQEFLLFQSSSGTLTKEALVEMDSLVGRIRQENSIAVSTAEAESTVTVKADDDDEKNDEDEDDVVLGDFL